MDRLPFALFTEEEKESYLTLTKENQNLAKLHRLRNNFPALIYVLGFRDLAKFHQKEIEEIGRIGALTDESSRRLWLWSRGFFKTSLITVAHTIHLILNNPNIRILLVSYTLDVARKMLKEIKEHFISNWLFRELCPQFVPKPNKEGKIEFGTTEEFVIPARKGIFKEPTVKAIGVGTNMTGLHFDYMKIDDLVTKDSVTNDTQIQLSKDYYAYLRPFFDNAKIPREDICGSIYHFHDLHCELKKSGNFRISFIPALDKNGKALFPERCDEATLESMRLDPSIGPHMVDSQYLLNPRNPKDAKFRNEWLRYYSSEELPEGYEYICVDPASTQKKKSDYTVMERWRVDWEGKCYLIDGIRDKLTAYQRIDKLFEMVRKAKNLKWVKYEVLGGRHGDLEMIEQKKQKEKLDFFIKETKATTSSKIDRIEQRLVTPHYAGLIYLPHALTYYSVFDGKAHDFVAEYKLEYLQFPFTEHDDILDCASQMFEEQLIKPSKPPEQPREKKEMTADDWDRFYDMIDYEQRLNPFLTREQAVAKARVNSINRVIRRANA